ncbi:MAG: ferredoxin [Pseudomonadota bacterium]
MENGCCIMCGVPLDEAPEVFAWADETDQSQCVVANQPQTTTALNHTLNAMWSGEVKCIRYRGVDPEIVRRLVEMGYADLCDQSVATGAVPLLRNHARFSIVDNGELILPQQVAADLLRHFIDNAGPFSDRRVRELRSDDTCSAVQISWFKGFYHDVTFEKLNPTDWLVRAKSGRPGVGIGLSRIVERWLEQDARIRDVAWFSEEQWRLGGPSQPTVV